MTGDRRQRLFDDWSEEEFRDRITSVEVNRAAEVTTVAGTQQEVLNIGIGSSEQLRIVGYKWYQADGGPTRARLQAYASVSGSSGYASLVEADYLHTPGEQEHQGEGWANPYTTVETNEDGSLVFMVDSLSAGAQASIDRVGVSLKAMRVTRGDEARL